MRNGAQGSICDCCGKTLSSFDTVRIKISKLKKGRKYEECTSYTYESTFLLKHYCNECVNKLIENIEGKKEK